MKRSGVDLRPGGHRTGMKTGPSAFNVQQASQRRYYEWVQAGISCARLPLSLKAGQREAEALLDGQTNAIDAKRLNSR